ncbi:MAG: peptidylprolyl isomerase [Firmicutes bacterium HGW-Firmicutes-15]|nr:MAG: peptidylprolyl isomerase [Firmicutes bacterium HGW-Firmicutes-15]
MVPVRFISEQLGADVSWDQLNQTVNVSYNQKRISIPIDSKFADVDGNEIKLDTNAVINNNRTMVPLRFVSEALGARVLWSSAAPVVRISNSNYDLSTTQSRHNKYKLPPIITIDSKKHYTAMINTNRGNFRIELFASQAPTTVNNFVFLARDGYFDGISFHRIIKDFMIQTGDPLGSGRGGPGYTFADELPPVKAYAPGIVAMANSGPNTNGSQFFICNGSGASQLNSQANYTVFGQVIDGMDVILKISDTPLENNLSGEISKPMEDVFIQKVTIEEN